MTKNNLILLVGSFLLSINASAAPKLSAQYQCYKSLMSNVDDGKYVLANDTVLVPLNDENTKFFPENKKGFYIYSETSAYFCELPASPHTKNPQYANYYFNLQAGDSKSVYMTYSEKLKGKNPPNIKTSITPVSTVKNYEILNCSAKLTDQTKALLMKEMKAKVSQAFYNYKTHRDYMLEKAQKSVSPEEYKSALNICSQVPELSQDVASVLEEFKTSTQPSTKQSSGTAR